MRLSIQLLCSFVLTATVLSAAGCSSDSMTITCDLPSVLNFYDEGAQVDSVIIQTCSPEGVYSDLGAAVIDGNTASFTAKVASPAIGRVKYFLSVPGGTGSSAISFVAEPGTITVDEVFSVYGSKCNDAIIDALERIHGCKDSLAAVRGIFTDFANKNNDAASVLLCVKSFPLVDNALWLSVVDSMDESVSGHSMVSGYKTEARRLMAQKKAQLATAIGSEYADFKGEWNGREYALSDYVNRGNYVLVDFWASWCMPCREEIPYIIRANDKYKDKGLVVLGVAISDKPEDTSKAMTSLGIKYTVFTESDGSASEAYGIRTIPQILLIGPDGTIIANDIRGDEIEETLSRYLK